MPTFGSLFAGIGGIDLGLERAGWECRWQVEWDEFCSTSLARNWPAVGRAGDIAAVDFRGLERVDLIAGGFPCQPVSVAGKRKAQADERWLWPEFARAIREVGPSYVLVENVRNLLAIDDGGPFGEVLGTLAALGYDAEWDCLPASAFGAPHQRDRLFLLAYANRDTLRLQPVAKPGRSDPTVAGGEGPALADAERMGPAGVQDAPRRNDDHRQDAGRAEEAGGSGERRPDDPSLADYDCWGFEEQRCGELPSVGESSRRSDAGGRCGAGPVEDADGIGGRRRSAGPSQTTGWRSRGSAAGSSQPMADAAHLDGEGFVGGSDDAAVGEVAGERPLGLRGGGRRRFGPPQSRVVRAPDGFPTWMDGHLWPAPPGPQYEWEPPRTVTGRLPDRASRVKALGNAVVPLIPEHLGRRLRQEMERPV